MNMVRKNLEELIKYRDSILPEAKFWNRQRLFLAWAFCAAIILTSGIELAKMISEEYAPWGLIILFVFGLVIIWKITKILNEATYYPNKVCDILNSEIKRLEKKK